MAWEWEIEQKEMRDKTLQVAVVIRQDNPSLELRRTYNFDVAPEDIKASIEAGVKQEISQVAALYLAEKELDQYLGKKFAVIVPK